MKQRRPIDILRDSGKSMLIGDTTAITDMIPMGDRLVIVKTHSIHAVQLADQIDPQRIDPNVPDTQQQILSVGSVDEIVVRTLLTAHTLFKRTYLGPSFDEDRANRLAYDILKDIGAIEKIRLDLEAAQAAAEEAFGAKDHKSGALDLPSIVDLDARVHAFAQKSGHVVHTLENMAKIFYPTKLSKKWIKALISILASKYGEKSETVLYVQSLRSFLLLVLGLRNMVEHPTPEKHATVFNYRLRPDRTIDRPAIEIVQPGENLGINPVSPLMKLWSDRLVTATEGLIGVLCDANVQPIAGLTVGVVELPAEQRANKLQRLYYGTNFNGQITRIG